MLRQLRLNTLENSRKTYSRVARAYLAGELDSEKARTLGYLLNGILQFWKLEIEKEFEQRLTAIEDALAGQK